MGDASNASAATEIAARYEELLAGRHRTSTVERVAAARQRPDLQYASEPVLGVLRPLFLTESTYRRVCRAAALLSSALSRATARLASTPSLRKHWGLERDHVRLLRLEIRHGAPLLLGRFDGFLSSRGSYAIIEYSNTPGGMVYGQQLAELFDGLPIMKELRRHRSLRYVPTMERMVTAYRRADAEWRGGEAGGARPRLAVVDRDLLAGDKYVEKRAVIALLSARGFEVVVVRSEELAFVRGRLRAQGAPVDAVYYLAEEALEARGEDAIIRALERRAVWLVVGPRDTARFSKSAFAVLSDPKFEHFFTPPELRALRRHLPWTRNLEDTRTRHGDRDVDLMRFVEDHRERLVLKPSLGASGNGVVLGWQVTPSAWRAALRSARDEAHVVQERVDIEEESLPILTPRGGVGRARHRSGLDPYTWNGRAGGCLVRSSRGETMGLLSGTSAIRPVFIVD